MFFTYSRAATPALIQSPLRPDPQSTIWSQWSLLKQWRRRPRAAFYRLPDTGVFGLTPLRTHILICGYPRAGTTLLLAMMEHALPHARRFRGEISGWRAATYSWRNHAVLISKKPDDIFCLHRLRNFYRTRRARLRTILMIRDPRDVLTSHHASTGPDVYFEDIPAWRRCHEYLRFYRHDPDVMVVRYEELVSNTPALRERIGLFTGEPAQRTFVDFYKSRMDDFDTGPLNGVRPVDRNTVGRWAAPQHRARIAEILRQIPDFPEILVELGYEPDRSWIVRWQQQLHAG